MREEEASNGRRREECGHYTIRGDVAERRERDPRMNYPFKLPKELKLEQIKSLFPSMNSRQCKRWDCQLCVREFIEFFEQDCPHQFNNEAGPSVAPTPLEAELVTKTNDPTIDKIKFDTSVAISTVQVLICTDVKNAEVEGTTRVHPKKPKAFFDLNKAPIDLQAPDEALENNNGPATKELVADNPERSVAELANNSNGCPSPEIQADDDLIPGTNQTSINRKARRYHTISYLNGEGKREGFQNVPQPKKTELKNKKKMQHCGIHEQHVGPKISEATMSRTIDFNLPLEQDHQLASVSISPRPESSGKRKHQVSCDQNGNSDAIVPISPEEGHEACNVPQLKKQRVFRIEVSSTLSDTEKENSGRAESDGVIKSKVIRKRCPSHSKNDPSSSKRKERLSPLGNRGTSLPTRLKKVASKEAHQLMLGGKLKNKHGGESSGIASEEKSPEKSSIVVGKELMSQDISVSTYANDDVPMTCLENDNFKLSQLKSEIAGKRMLTRGVSLKRLYIDSPSANTKQNVNRTDENGTSSPTKSQKSAEKGKDVGKLTRRAPQQKKNVIDKSSGKEVKKRGRKRKVLMSGASGNGSKKKDAKQPDTAGKALVLIKDITTPSPLADSEDALHLLSTVAEDFGSLSDTGLEDLFAPPNELAMGYGGCIQLTNPADHFLINGEGDRFKLGPEDLPLRPRRLLTLVSVPITRTGPGDQLLQQQADERRQWRCA